MNPDIQNAARLLASTLSASRDSVGVVGWSIDSEPRLRVFAHQAWLRCHAALPDFFAGYRVELQVHDDAQAYLMRCGDQWNSQSSKRLWISQTAANGLSAVCSEHAGRLVEIPCAAAEMFSCEC
jgi:hypothetical protein